MNNGDGESDMSSIENEILRRLKEGEQVDPEEYADRFPDHASDIRALCRGKQVPIATRGISRLRVGDRLQDYEIVELLGQGGMGHVFLARHTSLGRLVALKVLRDEIALEPALRRRFVREAQLAGSLSHPGIAQVFDAGDASGILFYVMRFVPGRSLSHVLAELRILAGLGDEDDPSSVIDGGPTVLHPRSGARGTQVWQSHAYILAAARVVQQVAVAVAAAHREKPAIVHRDLKPPNIILEESNSPTSAECAGYCQSPVVVDFGLARPHGSSGMTVPLDTLETPAYVAPEVHHDPTCASPQSDVFSLGVILHDMLTLAPPESRPRAYLGLRLVSDVNPRVDRSLAAIISHATEKDPRLRYENAGELADDLDRYLNREPVHARPHTVLEKAVNWTRRNRALAAAVLLGVVLLLLTVIGSVVVLASYIEQGADMSRARLFDEQGEFRAADELISRWVDQAGESSFIPLRAGTRDLHDLYTGGARRVFADHIPLARPDAHISLPEEGLRLVAEELSRCCAPERSISGGNTPYLLLAARLLSRGDNNVIRRVATGLSRAIEDYRPGPSQGDVHVCPLTAEMVWGRGGNGYILLAAPCLTALSSGRTPGTDERLLASTREELVRLLGALPTVESYTMLLGLARSASGETARLAILGMGRIGLWWSAARARRDVEATVSTLTADRLLEGTRFLISDDCLLQQADLPHKSLPHALCAHLLALRTWGDPTINDPDVEARQRTELRRRLWQRIDRWDYMQILLTAGATIHELENGVPPTHEQPTTLVLENLVPATVLGGRQEGLRLILDLIRRPTETLCEAATGMAAPIHTGWIEKPEADIRDDIIRLVGVALGSARGLESALPVPREPMAELLNALLDSGRRWEGSEIGNWWVQWGGPEIHERITQAAARLEDPVGREASVLDAHLVIAAARAGQMSSPKSIDLATSLIRHAAPAACPADDVAVLRFQIARLAAAEGQDSLALEQILTTTANEALSPELLLDALRDPLLRDLVRSQCFEEAVQGYWETVESSDDPSASDTFVPEPPLPHFDRELWRGECPDGFLASWKFGGDSEADSTTGLARLPVHSGDAERLPVKGGSVIVMNSEPQRCKLTLFFEVPPGRAPTAALTLRHLAAANGHLAHSGIAEISLWVNDSRIGEFNVYEFEHLLPQKFSIDRLLVEGMNQITIRYENGTSAYWLESLSVDGAVRASPDLSASSLK